MTGNFLTKIGIGENSFDHKFHVNPENYKRANSSNYKLKNIIEIYCRKCGNVEMLKDWNDDFYKQKIVV